MKTYKVEFEIVLKNDSTDWIAYAIEDQLEPKEFIDSFKIKEVNHEQTN